MKILIVDDHALIRDALCQLLPKLDATFVPLGAASCEQAFDVLRAEDDVGLVLMDLGLPGMCGSDGIKTLRAEHPELPIVALSGSEDRDLILAAIKNGAMGFIPKSYSWERVSAALQYILIHKGTFLPAEVMLGYSTPSRSDAGGVAAVPQRRVDPRSLGLTSRQIDVLRCVLQGKPNKAVARDLGIEDATVRSHVTAVLRALNVTTRTEAVVKAHEIGLVFDDSSARDKQLR